MKRSKFLKMGALTVTAPLVNDLFAGGFDLFAEKSFLTDDDILGKLIKANDKQVAILLSSISKENFKFSRKIGYDFSTLAASYISAGSIYYDSPLLIDKLEILTELLDAAQTADGTVNIGNLESPPDTAFLVELLTAGAIILKKDNSAELKKVNEGIKKFLVKAGGPLTTGGVHTPNHRWVISAALARLNELYPDKKYVTRINEWLSEGIYQDSDGHYPERSAIYSGVENTAFISIGRLLSKTELFDHARKNLDMMFYYMEPNGDFVTNDSRRQDQYMQKNKDSFNVQKSIVSYYLQYRYFAIKDNNRKFAAITRAIENFEGFEKEILGKALFHFLEEPMLLQPLPAIAVAEENFEKLFATSNLLRIRRGNTSATVFGGVDWPLTIASGRSNSPDFFAYRKGKAILKYMRLSTNFFSTGYFYSEGIRKAGNKYILHKKLSVPYYQPLPANKTNSKGDYKLSPSTDGRFWNKMDFQNRPVSNVKNLETIISFTETNGAVELDINVAGLAGVPVTIELCFLEGGKLSGVNTQADGNSFLENGMGIYESDNDTIQFGPGIVAHKTITSLEGERYSTHFGSLRTEGMHVYLTATTPFDHRLKFS